MRTFVEKFIAKEMKTELDLEYPFYDREIEDEEERNEVLTPTSRLPFVEAPSMDIGEVIRILTDLKEKGANRVYIADHCDHHVYYFYGVNLMEI